MNFGILGRLDPPRSLSCSTAAPDHDLQGPDDGCLSCPQLESVRRRLGPERLAHPLGRGGDAPSLALSGADPAGGSIPVQRHGHRVPADPAVRLPPHPAGHRGTGWLALRVDGPGPRRPRSHHPQPPGRHRPHHAAEAGHRAAPPGPGRHRAEGLRRGEWKVRRHGYSKRRTWLKLHLAIDPQAHEIQAAMVSEPGVTDAEMVPPLLEQGDNPLGGMTGDGAYDRATVYAALDRRGARAIIPPRRDAKIQRHGNTSGPRLARDEDPRRIRRVGRRAGKEESGYHRRSLGETAMPRMKTLFGDGVSSRREAQQATEAGIRCRALNIMTHQGMPRSQRVA